MERYLWSALGVLLAVSIGAFLLYVPMLPLAIVAVVLIGFVLTFFLGLCFGAYETAPADGVVKPKIAVQNMQKIAMRKITDLWRRLT